MSEIRTIAQLRELYPHEPSKGALGKECDRITPAYQELIEAAPFMIIATAREGALDCSPRGDGAGFVHVRDEHTIVIPDRNGNNRLDTLSNIIADPRVGLIFLIPGVGECIRVRGTATITADPAQLDSYAVKGRPPRSLLEVSVERVFFQCSRAIMRSKLWDPESVVDRADLPSSGRLLEEANLLTREQADAYDETAYETLAAHLY